MKLLGFKEWEQKETRDAQKLCKEVVISKGLIQYSDIGEGDIILFIHGSLGGCDSGPMLFDPLISKGFRLISPSRPGYLKTSLDLGESPEEQALTYKELLDRLGIYRVAVIAHSGGTPSAIAFATTYPEKVSSLILYAPVSHRWERRLSLLEKILSHDFPLWILYAFSNFFPSLTHRIFSRVLSVSYKDVKNLPKALAFIDWFRDSLMPIKLRMPGLKNDLKQFALLTKPRYNKIKCPVYIFHGTHDHELPSSFSTYVTKQLEGERFLLSEGGHEPTLIIKGETVLEEITNFVRSNAH